MRTRLTLVGKLFIALMVLFYGASVTSQSGLLLLLIGLIGGCFAVNWSFARRNVKSARVTPPREVYLVEGGKPSQPWRIENLSRKHLENLEIRGGETRFFHLPLIATGETLSVVPEVIFPRRGVFPHEQTVVTSTAPYGLLRATRELKLEGFVTVYPRVYDAISPASAGFDVISGGRFRGGRKVNHGSHFAGVRPWQDGDSIKQVHWKTTARRDQLMVKTFEEELGGRVSLLLDIPASAPAEAVDNAARAAASLGTAVLQEGHHLEFIDCGPEPALRLAPFSDEHEFLNRLAAYNPPVSPSEVHLETLARKSTLAAVGTEWQEHWRTLIADAGRLNRAVHIYLPEGREIPREIEATLWHFDAREIRAAETPLSRA